MGDIHHRWPFKDQTWSWIGLLFVILFAIAACACGSTTDRQTKTVETEQWQTSPFAVESPFGTFTVHPGLVNHKRTQDEVEQTKKVFDMPDALPMIQAVASTTPWGGIITGAIGLLTAGWATHKATKAKRMLVETVEGVENAKNDLPAEHWHTLTGSLAKAQSRDTRTHIDTLTP